VAHAWRTVNKLTHRWLSMVLGVWLLAVTTSGALLVYAGGDGTLGLGTPAAGVSHTGAVGFLVNLHSCGLTCPDYPGYVPALAAAMPGLPGTVGGFLLAAAGVILGYLILSGLVLWWPGRRRLRHGFSLQLRRGRYRRDLDLHKVIGFAAAPFLLAWALVSAGLELPGLPGAPGHVDTFLDPLLRAALFLSGLSPVILAVTGLSTWLHRRARGGRPGGGGRGSG
jgi:hypothetical protein